MRQIRIPAIYMRGGTSRALIFHQKALPADRADWDAIFLAALGSPDPGKRQLDGLGGGISSLSKIAVVGPPTRDDADVDYTFAQVAVDAPVVGYRANCGNISSAIGPFAVEEGLVAASGDTATVRIHNTNTGKIIVSTFPLEDGVPAVEGGLAIDGVAGTGAPVRLGFRDPGGAATGRLLPTGRVRDRLVPDIGEPVEVSLVDAANPVVFIAATTLGLTGVEVSDALGETGIAARLESIRVAAAVAMGLGSDAEAWTTLRNLPLVCIISPPQAARLASGRALEAGAVDVTVRMISAGQPHKATPLTGAMCTAVAVRVPGSIPAAMLRPGLAGDVRIGHAGGTLLVAASLRDGIAEEVVVYRTARRLMQGEVLVPSSALRPAPITTGQPLSRQGRDIGETP
ncbi:PrpF domain-containing protein [Roseomonas sp. F4]